MNLDSFASLVEIQGFNKQIQNIQKEISKEEERVLSLQKKRAEKEKTLSDCLQNLTLLKKETDLKEKNLFEKESLITRAMDRQKTATNEGQCKAIEKELEVFLPQKDQIETELYALLEKQDLLLTESAEAKAFLEGSLKTLKEIQAEVDKICEEKKKQVTALTERIKQTLELSTPEVRGLWADLSKKFQKESPLAFIENGVCGECHSTVGRNLEGLIEKGTLVEFCTHCKRLLTPRKRV